MNVMECVLKTQKHANYVDSRLWKTEFTVTIFPIIPVTS